MEVEEERRGEDREDDPAGLPDQDPGDHAAHERACETEPDRGENPHRIRPRQRQPRQRTDD